MQPRILLVDDENAIRDSLYALLEGDGYEVLAASNGPDGLTIFRQSTPPIDLLVTDYNMPQMSGLELARACSLLSKELSVLYISGSHPDENLRICSRTSVVFWPNRFAAAICCTKPGSCCPADRPGTCF